MPLLGARATASRGYFGGGTPPDAPTSLVATRGNTQLSVAFSAPAFNGGLEITTYEYALSTNSYATWTTRATGTTASPLVITGLSNGTSYQVKLRAVNTLGAGAVSAASTAVTPATVPGTPTSPSISSGNGSISVSWGAPSDGGDPPLTYTVETQKNNEAYVNRGLQTSTYPLSGTGIDNGATYRARITANNTVGSSATAAVTGDTVPSAVPDAPAAPTATIGNGQVVLAWVAPADNGSTISDYDIEQTTDDGVSWTDSAYASAVVGTTVASLTNGTTYKFRVRATNGRGIGAWSAASDGYKPGTVPSTPSAPTLTGGDRSLTSTFTAPASNGYDISGYEINYSYDSGTNWSGWSAAVSPQVNAAFNGFAYKVKIRATNAIGTSGESALSNAITPTFAAPSLTANGNYNAEADPYTRRVTWSIDPTNVADSTALAGTTTRVYVQWTKTASNTDPGTVEELIGTYTGNGAENGQYLTYIPGTGLVIRDEEYRLRAVQYDQDNYAVGTAWVDIEITGTQSRTPAPYPDWSYTNGVDIYTTGTFNRNSPTYHQVSGSNIPGQNTDNVGDVQYELTQFVVNVSSAGGGSASSGTRYFRVKHSGTNTATAGIPGSMPNVADTSSNSSGWPGASSGSTMEYTWNCSNVGYGNAGKGYVAVEADGGSSSPIISIVITARGNRRTRVSVQPADVTW